MLPPDQGVFLICHARDYPPSNLKKSLYDTPTSAAGSLATRARKHIRDST
jgi:hypothetical protein